MQRYFLDKNDQFNKDDLHHIVNVMRFKTDDEVEICKDGVCHLAKLQINNKEVSFFRLNRLVDNFTKDITLVQGLPKGEKLETVTKYATLFGARNICFVPMARSIAKLANIDHKLERLKKISKEASELSKRSEIPSINFFNSLKDMDVKDSLVIVADEYEKTKTLKDVLDKHNFNKIIIVIGPEGGIDEKDRKILDLMHAQYITLGLTILPTELAHIPVLNQLYL
ncbi:RsmE family RNA methyltransferase [Acholeplasma hippikon]|uniref:Ribosomal RNA small subunit methyltransferase E n=1 Tax=Acholeplasma hippikon TaxID=264636 RepID=A0A449BHX1_9MOLU|nr:RsmE family RNA methyltransferase [Acholeplasma hippikon]VEU82045.1 16S ribosomal RNA methyltransferase RsmE [Acholeplasma hippikon]